MTYKATYARSGLTAIAAVLALSSTPLAAQEVTTPPDPVTETPANPPPAADPLSPAPAPTEPSATESSPEAAAPATMTRRTATRARTAAPARAPARAVSQPQRAVTPAAPPAEAVAEPMAVPPLPAEPVAEPIAPPVEEPAPTPSNFMADESLPIAAAAGLGLLALGGLGLAIGRRRRRRLELDHIRANERYLDEHPPEAMPAKPMPNDNEPAFVRASPAMAAAAPEAQLLTDAPRTKLPNGFDLSRFGPHVRAAYMGPTPDNPSLSMKYRLRRAAAMDQRARLDAEKRPKASPQPAARPQPASQPAWAMNDAGFMLRRDTSMVERRRELARQASAKS